MEGASGVAATAAAGGKEEVRWGGVGWGGDGPR